MSNNNLHSVSLALLVQLDKSPSYMMAEFHVLPEPSHDYAQNQNNNKNKPIKTNLIQCDRNRFETEFQINMNLHKICFQCETNCQPNCKFDYTQNLTTQMTIHKIINA